MTSKQSQNQDTIRLTENKLIEVLVVKATEENSKKVLPHMTVSSANIMAISAKSDNEFLEKRASFLFDHLPDSLKSVSSIMFFPRKWYIPIMLISIVFGLLSNYLGPSKLIHVVYNPLTILLAWNVFIYLWLIVKSVFRIGTASIEKPIKAISKVIPAKNEESEQETDEVKDKKHRKKQSSGNFIIDWIIGGFFKNIMAYRIRFTDDAAKYSPTKEILLAFWNEYKFVAGKSLIFRFQSLVNMSAIGLLIGALAGVYLRGLFFNYNMVWQSTFVSDPETILLLLNIVLGPASLILDGSLIQPETIQLLLNPEGTSAGPWIHKLALSAFLIILIPRSFMVFTYAKVAARKILPLDISGEYYTEILEDSREKLLDVIRDGIREIITKKIKRIGMTISDFVINDYYEKIISPILINFREKGGKIRKLEEKLLKSQVQFEPILLSYLKEIQEDFRESVLTEINLFLGRKLVIDINTLSSYSPQSDEIDQKISNKIAEDIGDTIGGTIVTTVAVAAGTVSGGIGKSLGIAIISGLIGVSGPIGLLIGGLITAITLGGFYKLKREQISGMIKDVPFPAFVISMTLSDSKIEKARIETFQHTKKEITKMLEPKSDEVTEGILRDLTY